MEHGKKEGSRDERFLVLKKVVSSKVFSRSDSCQQILKFIIEKFIAGYGGDLKEYTIATEAMGRPLDFDPKSDNIVRIQMQRLRERLEKYYSEEGADDQVRIAIPYGHYVPEFHSTPTAAPPTRSQEPIQEPKSERPFAGIYRMLFSILPWGLVALLLVVVVIMGVRLSQPPASSAISSSVREPLPRSLAQLWKPFISLDVPLIIVYNNPLYLADDYWDLYPFSLSSTHPLPVGARVQSLVGLERLSPIPRGVGTLYYYDLMTGTGEVVGTAKVTRLLATQKQDFSVERSGLVSYDNIRNNNTIFIGGPVGDTILGELPLQTDLVFSSGLVGVVDRHPAAGRPDTYRLSRDHKTGETQTDYALISSLPSVAPDRHILVLAGIQTLGTQAACEFVTSPSYMAILEGMRGDSRGNPVRSPYFQALLEVPIRNGTVAQINCVLVRELRRK